MTAPRRPQPNQIEALQAAADGCSLAVAAQRIDITVQMIASRLSHCYDRLGIDRPGGMHSLSPDRRYMAIQVCRDNGWWPAEHADGCTGAPDHTEPCEGDRGQL
jgi:DNA-binding NarL/FixJ family response regulator